ncbi:MAG: NUDIX hydrolase [Candidatus Neomarinimicrobiota bacterium]
MAQLQLYQPVDTDDRRTRQRIMDFINSDPSCGDRTNLSGHLTASAWIIDRDHTSALLTHHRKLDIWIQCGGHADGELDLLRVASREAREETGLVSLESLSPAIFDVDVHTIPANGTEPRHFHYDVRYLFQAEKTEPLTCSEESQQLAWISLEEIAHYYSERSLLRMVEKTPR